MNGSTFVKESAAVANNAFPLEIIMKSHQIVIHPHTEINLLKEEITLKGSCAFEDDEHAIEASVTISNFQGSNGWR